MQRTGRGNAEQGYRGKKEEEVEWDYSLKPVIGVFLCNFHVTGLDQKPIVRASVLDEDSLKPIAMKTRYIFVQLPFFDKEEDECEEMDDKWIYNIKNMGIRQEVAFKSNSEIFRRLAEVANVATLTPEQRYHYEADVKNARDTLNQIRGAFQDGEQKGRLEGLAEGRAEGRAKERKESIRFMLSLGVPAEVIATKYGMTPEEVIRISSEDDA